MTALNLLCLARLQEMLQSPVTSLAAVSSPASLLSGLSPIPSLSSPNTSAPSVPVNYQTKPHNRKIFKCDYDDCTKVN